jgi:chromosome segregation protein
MTTLKALELFGFKSFADRTRFEFPAGITVVVGPNGSGKSNVVDAIKWVLGEQSVRSLRGKEMSDVIFAGSGSRKPLNYAEVSLVFDNSAGLLPVESAEVQITRRVQRSGESEYLVNGETSRLKDIRELFSGTGAATQAYSVIEQGRVDALLVASGRDRRAVFEEAAGITRFRTRRTEALRRLERAELNRQRLADIVGEVSSRLETVRHQAAKARRWRLMTDRLRALRLAAAREDLAAVDATVAAVETALDAARADSAALESRTAAAAAEATEAAARAERLVPATVSARGHAATDTQRVAAAEATLALHRTRRVDLEADLARTAADLDAAVAAERAAAGAVAETDRTVAGMTARAAEIAMRLEASELAARGSHDDVAGVRRRLAEAGLALDDRRRERARLEAACELAGGRAEEAHRAADAARAAVETTQREAARLAEAHAAWEGNVGSLGGRLEAATREVETLEANHRTLTESVEGAWHDLSAWKAKLEACRERCGILEEMIGRREGLSEAARRLLRDGGSGVPGLAGTLADVIEASVDWAPLVDLALGGLGQSLVVASLEDAVHWHARWSGSAGARDVLTGGGRVGFLAVDGSRPAADFDPGTYPGIVGRLDRLLQADGRGSVAPAAAPLLERLLGRFWIVDRVEQALPLLPSAPPETVFMSRAGECLSADGSFEIGTPAAATGQVARRSELRALCQRRTELESTVETADRRVAGIQAEIAELRTAVRHAQSRRQQAAETVASSRVELDRVQRERHAAEAAIAAAERDLRAADQRAVDAVTAVQAARAAFAESEPALDAARDAVARAEAAIAELERDRGERVEESHRLRVEQATCTEKLARCREAVESHAAALADCRERCAAARRRRHDAEERLAANELDLLAAGAEHAEAVAALERSTAALAAVAAEAEATEGDRRRLAAGIDDMRAAAARLADALHAHELEAGEARHRRARIVERIRDEYDLDLDADGDGSAPSAPSDEPLAADRTEMDREIEELRRKLAAMTTVNLEALAESEELAARLATLEAQLTDITVAKESIAQLIARIDDESRTRLGETIETVRGHFREFFERLFGGGQADIVLEPGVDLLETAVEIVARPPGKEPRNISLLSGGEKTMTCVALLLAIFKSRPSPFCVLDEVDAALDEANVDRFVSVLRDFLSATQCIVVTHSKKTMAAATTLYGVTMEESGVSKRVSVRFEATAAAARPAARAA